MCQSNRILDGIIVCKLYANICYDIDYANENIMVSMFRNTRCKFLLIWTRGVFGLCYANTVIIAYWYTDAIYDKHVNPLINICYFYI